MFASPARSLALRDVMEGKGGRTMRSLRLRTVLIGTVVMLVLGGGTASAARGAVVPADTAGIVGCADPIHSDSAPPATFRFWVCADGNPDAQSQLDDAAAIAESYYRPMTALMGEPFLDSGGPEGGDSSAIDIYLLDGNSQQVYRDGENRSIGKKENLAVTVATSLIPDTTSSSAFILMNRNRLGNREFPSDFIHEFFHVLQDKYNYTTPNCKWWYTEASATWAEEYFDPADSRSRIATRLRNFEKDPSQSLFKSDPYDAFIWPYFQAQEQGATAIQQTWEAVDGKEIEAMQSCDDLNGALNSVFPFADHFRDFAVRNLDYLFNRPQGKPEVPRNFGPTYQQALASNGLPQSTFPYAHPSMDSMSFTSTSPGTQAVGLNLPPESTEYIDVQTMTTSDALVGALQLDIAGLTNTDNLSLDTIGIADDKAHAHWIRIHDAHPTDGVCTLWDNSTAAELILVLTNSSTTNTVDGTAHVRTQPNCATSASGTITHTQHVVTSDFNVDTKTVLDDTVKANLKLKSNPEGGLVSVNSPYTYSFSGSITTISSGDTCQYSGSGSAVMNGAWDADGGVGGANLHGYDLHHAPYVSEWAHPTTPASGCQGGVTLDDWARGCPIVPPGGLNAEPDYSGKYADKRAKVNFNCDDSWSDSNGNQITESFTGSLKAKGVIPCGLYTASCADGEPK